MTRIFRCTPEYAFFFRRISKITIPFSGKRAILVCGFILKEGTL